MKWTCIMLRLEKLKDKWRDVLPVRKNLSINPVSSPVLLRFAPVDHVLFGTDFLFAPEIMMHKTIEGLQQRGLRHGEVRLIEGENAQPLLSLV
ncbi:MAG: hypothetical protein V2B19_30600 [Pseudomonadota bacterium]